MDRVVRGTVPRLPVNGSAPVPLPPGMENGSYAGAWCCQGAQTGEVHAGRASLWVHGGRFFLRLADESPRERAGLVVLSGTEVYNAGLEDLRDFEIRLSHLTVRRLDFDAV